MTRHDDMVRLRHMLDYASEAVEMACGVSPDDLKRNRMLQLALVRLVEIVGEAATKVSEEGQHRYPSIPWQYAAGCETGLSTAMTRSTWTCCGTRSNAICRP